MADFEKLVNVQANLQQMKSKSRYTDIGDGETKLFRFLPPLAGSNNTVFYLVQLHWKLKDQDGNNIALADLSVHGNEETGTDDYLTRLANFLQESNNKLYQKIGADIKSTGRYYAQGFEGTILKPGEIEFAQKPTLLSLPKTPSKDILNIMDTQINLGEPPMTDAERGQAVVITRIGTGRSTKYTPQRHGKETNLDEIVPGWRDKAFDDVYGTLGLKIYTPEMQKKIARVSYPDLDWEMLEKEYDL